MHSLQEIERAINELQPQQLAELYAWLDQHRPAHMPPAHSQVFEQGLGLFSSPNDAELLDDVVNLAYQERRRPTAPKSSL